MNLESLERERIKVYKDYLRQQVQKHAKQRKQQNNYQRKKEQVDMNQLINRLNEDDIRRLQQRRNTAILLKQHNSGLSNLRKSGIYPDQHQQNALLNNNSFLDHINKKDVERIHKNKQGYVNNWQENQMQENFRRNREERDRSLEREEEGKHMDRLKAMELESRKNYQQIKRKHEQNMKIYDMHSNLMHENQQYRRMAQKFTQCEDDIISRLKRNQSAQRKRNLKFNQDVLKHQMDEYNERRSLQRSQILQGQDIDASIFKNLLHGSPNYKKQYGQQLKSQMSEMETRKVGEKYALKQKYKIGGIFGGEHGREREQQIKYVDRKLGLRKGESYNREAQQDRSRQLNNARRSISVNNEEEEQYRNPPKHVPEKSTQYQQYQPQQQRQSIYQPHEPQLQRQSKQSQHSSPPPTVSTNLPQLQSPPSIPFQQKISITPRNAYGLPYNESPSNRYQQQQQQQAQKKLIPIAAGDPGVAYRNGNQNGADKKFFRSFDLVTGQNRFYG